jgi:hypothetical protein
MFRGVWFGVGVCGNVLPYFVPISSLISSPILPDQNQIYLRTKNERPGSGSGSVGRPGTPGELCQIVQVLAKISAKKKETYLDLLFYRWFCLFKSNI